MALTITQLYDPSFLSQLGPEYVCTGFMFDKDLPMESIESQLSKEGFIPGIGVEQAEKTFTKMNYDLYVKQAGADAAARGWQAGGKAAIEAQRKAIIAKEGY